jgi:hypothetical protein
MTQPQPLEFTPGLTFSQKIGMVAGSVSALYLLPSAANAAIIHVTTPLSVSLGSGGDILWDVDGAGGSDFRLFASTSIYLDSDGLNGRGMVQTTQGSYDDLQKLNTGFNVGPTLAAGYQWRSPGQASRTVMTSGGNIGYDFSNGGFTSPGTGYFGFRFESGGNTFYGWANIDIGQTTPGTVTITEWAYNNTPNGTISVSTPESTSSLALLAFGAAGVYRWRRNRKPAQVEEDKAA